MVNYDKSKLPDAQISAGGHTWQRENFDKDSWNWTRPLTEDEYDWDADEVSLVGTDVPIYAVELRYDSNKDNWSVSAAETAGPNYHRPGYTELISGEWAETFDVFEDACSCAERFITQLS